MTQILAEKNAIKSLLNDLEVLNNELLCTGLKQYSDVIDRAISVLALIYGTENDILSQGRPD